jgi:cellulose synthase operon protein C
MRPRLTPAALRLALRRAAGIPMLRAPNPATLASAVPETQAPLAGARDLPAGGDPIRPAADHVPQGLASSHPGLVPGAHLSHLLPGSDIPHRIACWSAPDLAAPPFMSASRNIARAPCGTVLRHQPIPTPPRARLRPSRPAAREDRLGALRAALAVLLMAVGSWLAPQAAAQVPGVEDLRALIYYLDQNDQRSVQAEMRRLRNQFPGWTPPPDLNALRAMAQQAGAAVAERPIWARIERGDHAGARALIDQGRAAVPGWVPSAELTRLLDLNEGQAAFDAAIARRDAAAAIAAARRAPAIMRCDRINNAWQLAEMYHQAGQTDVAIETYRGVAGSCSRQADAVATIEKANEIATWPQMETLFAAARAAGPANATVLDQLQARLRAGRGLRGGAPVPAAAAAPRAPAATVADAPAVPVVPAVAAGAGAPPSSLPLRGDGRLAATRRLKEQGQWAGCLAQSTGPRSIELLYERSWCAYNLERPGEALAGFMATERTGTALGPDVGRDARFGMILSYLALNMTEEGARLAAATNLSQRQRVEVETIILDQRGVRAFHLRDYAQAVTYFNALEQIGGPLRRDLAMLRGYALLNGGQAAAAHAEFTRLHSQLATDETRAALRAAAGRMSGG